MRYILMAMGTEESSTEVKEKVGILGLLARPHRLKFSFKISTKHQSQNLDQTSASKTQPNYSHHYSLELRERSGYQIRWFFGKAPKGEGVIFNPKIYIADFGKFKQGFLIMKLIQNKNFRVRGKGLPGWFGAFFSKSKLAISCLGGS